MAERVEYNFVHSSSGSYKELHPRILPTAFDGRPPLVGEMGLRSADTLTLNVPRTRLSFGDRAFVVAGPRAWNNLPLHVRSARSISALGKLLKTHLFSRAYLWLFIRVFIEA